MFLRVLLLIIAVCLFWMAFGGLGLLFVSWLVYEYWWALLIFVALCVYAANPALVAKLRGAPEP